MMPMKFRMIICLFDWVLHIMKKKCFKCNVVKDISDFYVHKSMADGHLGKCIECAIKDSSEHRRKNIERIREYDRQRGKLPHRIKQSTEYRRKYRKDNPMKYAAHIALGNAVRDGKVKKSKRCQTCKNNSSRLFGHHFDYSKPLEVIWVCQICHKKIHKKAG